MSIKNNTTSLQEILETINALPEAGGGVELPTLTNPATEGEIFLNKETLDADGNLRIGAFTIDSELNTQDDLITQIQEALTNKTIKTELVEYSENEDAIISGTITNYTNNRIVTIGHGAFAYHNSLISVSFPVCTTIGSYAFTSCSSLTTVSFPACTSTQDYVFTSCSKLTTVSFPVCTTIGNHAFDGCSGLTTVSFPTCTTIGSYAFWNCYSLTTVSFPVCTSIIYGALSGCHALTTVYLPVCTSISGVFNYCFKLTTVSFPACTHIGTFTFRRCQTLSSLTLGASSVCTLSNSNAFQSTPFAGYSVYFNGTPHIYVPASLVDAYKSATNWVYFSSYITAISANLITFTICAIEYQAEEGMTWEEWINSDYNTGGFYASGSMISQSEDGYTESIYADPNTDNEVFLTDIIIANKKYYMA